MKYEESREDELLRAAFTLVGESEEFQEADVKFSAEHEAKMQKLFQTEKRRQRAERFRTYASRAAVLAAAVVLVGGVSVEAWRVKVINFVLDTTDKYTEIKFAEEKPAGENVTSYSVGDITIGYIPEGYHVSYESSNPKGDVVLEFTNEEARDIIFFERVKATTTLTYRIDTEDAEITEFDENGYHVIKSVKDRVQILTWYNSEYIYTVTCEAGEDELIQVAKNIKFQ